MTLPALTTWLAAAKEAALRAAVVLEDWRRRFSVRGKARFDLVTEAALASQKTIYEFLGKRFPGHEFPAEADVSQRPGPGGEAPPAWMTDPREAPTTTLH